MQTSPLTAQDHIERSIIVHSLVTGEITSEAEQACENQYNAFHAERWAPKTGRHWGAIHNYIREKLRDRKETFTYALFSPPLEPRQAKSALIALCKNREIIRVTPGRHGRTPAPAVYRHNFFATPKPDVS